jgi:erythronate-4-phosphate dehydrogenase
MARRNTTYFGPLSGGAAVRVVADANIPMVEQVLGDHATVERVPGRELTRDALRGVSVLLVRSVTRVNADLLDGTDVQFVASATIGIDHVDRAYLQQRGIGFAHAPGSNANSVAEHVVAALLWCSRNRGVRLQARTLGVVGVGNVGGRVVALAPTLGLVCLRNDPPKHRASADPAYLPLEQVLAQADIVTLHVPLTAEGPDPTYHLANDAFFGAMKSGAVFVNTSRGDVVDEAALRRHRGKLGAVVLDVWSGEPCIATDTLALADVATPHVAGYSYDGKLCGTQMVCEAACAHYGLSPAMDIVAEAGRERVSIDVTGAGDPLYDAVMRAYPIGDEDARLRAVVDMPAPQRGPHFDRLRREYPRRLEYRHYTVNGAGKDGAVLSGLGFGTAPPADSTTEHPKGGRQ